MQLKDYYTTLECAPGATDIQIKKSFRQLALKHHPDKNPGSALAEARFKEIQEAYETLSNPEKREEYNYKRWYSRTLRKNYSSEPLDPQAILAECTRLTNYLETANVFSLDYDGLSQHIRKLLSNKNIAIVQQDSNQPIKEKIISKLLEAANPLPFIYIQPIAALLLSLAAGDNTFSDQINQFVHYHKQKNDWQKFRIPLVVLVTILLCLLIYLVS